MTDWNVHSVNNCLGSEGLQTGVCAHVCVLDRRVEMVNEFILEMLGIKR